MKKMNQLSLLTLIMELGPISRTGLSVLSRLSKPTVSAQVEDLIRRRLVSETGTGESGKRGGKKPTHLEFNADYGYLAVAEIDPLVMRLAVTDLKGSIIAQAQFKTEAHLGAASVTGRLKKRLVRLLKQSGRAEQLCMIAIAAPGRVDVRNGVILAAGNIFNWENVPIAHPLATQFKTPVLVDNVVNLAALAEMNYGAAKGVEDFVLVSHETGIGCGVVLGGKLHRGSNWAAGEIAHYILDWSEADKVWTPRGYLELQVGADRLTEKIQRTQALRTLLPRYRDGDDEIAALIRAWKHGRAETRKIVNELVLQLGVSIANVAATYDPSLIVLQGEIFPPLFEEIEQVVKRAVPWLPRLSLSKVGKDAVLRGAIVAARARAYEEIAKALNEGESPNREVDSESGLGEMIRSESAA
jgi:predicted NBD/HSP70 family sugar kinase